LPLGIKHIDFTPLHYLQHSIQRITKNECFHKTYIHKCITSFSFTIKI
jgi:hypothetical protein